MFVQAFVLTWNPGREPTKDSCASWCRWSDENCVSPFKAAQCQGCASCKALKAAAAVAALNASACNSTSSCVPRSSRRITPPPPPPPLLLEELRLSLQFFEELELVAVE